MLGGFSDSTYREPHVNFVQTFPPVSPWNFLHPRGSNHSVMCVRIWDQASKITNQNWLYELHLDKYYDYCTATNINVLGHTLDHINNNNKCGVSFYFASMTDKAAFILKFK